MPVISDPFPLDPTADPHTAVDGLTVLVPPAEPLVSWAEMKSHLRLDSDAEQADVEHYVAAATAYAERATASTLTPRTYLAIYRSGQPIVLARGPVTQVLSVLDAAGLPITYTTRHDGHRLELRLISAGAYPIGVTYVAGHADAMMRLAVRQIAAASYRNRESSTDKQLVVVPHAAESFLKLHSRALGVG